MFPIDKLVMYTKEQLKVQSHNNDYCADHAGGGGILCGARVGGVVLLLLVGLLARQRLAN